MLITVSFMAIGCFTVGLFVGMNKSGQLNGGNER